MQCLLAVTIVAASGSSLLAGSGFAPAEAVALEEAIDRWKDLGATDYSFNFQLQCNCMPDETAKVLIEVVDSRITAVTYAEDVYEVREIKGTLRKVPLYSRGTAVRDELAKTFLNINSLLAEMRSVTSEPLAEFEAVFDAHIGVPCRVYYNFSGPAVDDELEFFISGFEFNKGHRNTQLGCAAATVNFDHFPSLEERS